ncbi:MAG: DUF1192 domain-containing protein [Rhizobiaceae bacterium]|nr:DUF1192 domain-containing protein [Rhizobiaceae bacterium]
MDEEEAKKPLQFLIGQDLSDLSVEEINETIHELKQEITRLEEAANQKSSHLSAAEALFK